MFRLLLLLIIIVPAAEMAILILSGNYLGIWPTIALVILTGVAGAWLAKKEGLHAVKVAQLQMQQGEIPNALVLDGICILVGGVVLLTPGFITDLLGFFLLIPQTRAIAKAFLTKQFKKMAQNGQIYFTRR